eukprot:TRINITY_DN2493_c0_g1_i1.p1 TRINITY_DN2493_c0_g1~~TRINITY_DN2493_c0_g1_i1.p1  ORF type:complete len:196 (-),score=39.18 TRINITY_DN2493_c0_g1_i1:831-1418(-)
MSVEQVCAPSSDDLLCESASSPKVLTAQITQEQARSTLEPKIEQRPTRRELVEHNILKPGDVAPILQATHDVLKRQHIERHLDTRLDSRPSIGDLKDHNIIKNPDVAPSLVPIQEALWWQKREDILESKLSHRATFEDLVHQRIIPDEKDVERRRHVEGELEVKLDLRPSFEHLRNTNIIKSLVFLLLLFPLIIF